MKLTNPPLVSCRDCGVVMVARIALDHTVDEIGLWKNIDWPELLAEVEQRSIGNIIKYEGIPCPARQERTGESEYDCRTCGCSYWQFVEVP